MKRYLILFAVAVSLVVQGLSQDRTAARTAAPPDNYTAEQVRYAAMMDSLQRQIGRFRSQHQTADLLAAMDLYSDLCIKTSQPEALLQNARELATMAIAGKNRFLEAKACISIGSALMDKNQLDSALYYEERAMQLSNALRHDSLLAETYICLSGIYQYRKDYRKRLLFCEKALAHAESWGTSKRLLVICLGNKALAHSWLQQYKEAVQLEQKALPMAEALGNGDYITTIKMNLASNYVSLGNYSRARRYLAELEQTMPQHRVSPYYLTNNMAIIGMIYWDMRDQKKAATLLLQQIPAVEKMKNAHMLQRIYDTLSVMAEATQRYKEALAYKKQAQRYQAQMQKQNSNELFSELEVRYQTAEKEKALSQKGLQLAQKDLQLQKNRYYMYCTVAALVVALLLTALLYLQSRNKKLTHARELQAVSQQREIELLQALMQGEEKERSRIARDLHDGVAGMLAAVKMHLSSVPEADQLLHTEGYRQGMALLNEAAQEIRKTSHNLMPEVLLQHGLDEALRRYCSSVSNHRRLFIQYDSWGVIDRFTGGFELSVYRIVQELIANMLKHSRATQAVVQLSQQEALLCLSIEDNGVGFAAQSTATGMGLHSLHSRIRALNGKLELHTSEQNGVCAYLEFETTPLKKEPTAV